MRILVQVLQVLAFVLGLVQLVWIGRYAYEDFGGLIGLVVAWVIFPITLIVSPFYGVLAHRDWLGVLLFVIGPATYVVVGAVGATLVMKFGRSGSSQDETDAATIYGTNGGQVVALLKWLRSLSPQQVTLLAGLFGANHGLMTQSGSTAQDQIRHEQSQSDAELFNLAIRELTRLPSAAIDRADLPMPLAVRASAEATLAAIDRSGRTPPAEVASWAPMGAAELAMLLVTKPEADPPSFRWLWSHYSSGLPDLGIFLNGPTK